MGNLHVNQVATNQTPTTTTETVIATVTPFNVQNPAGEGVYLNADVFCTPGTGTTAVTLRIRVGSLTGTVLGNPQAIPVTAGVVSQLGLSALDPSTVLGSGVTYVLTYQAAGASANATVQQSVLTAESATAYE